jgi:hypothetical protein
MSETVVDPKKPVVATPKEPVKPVEPKKVAPKAKTVGDLHINDLKIIAYDLNVKMRETEIMIKQVEDEITKRKAKA